MNWVLLRISRQVGWRWRRPQDKFGPWLLVYFREEVVLSDPSVIFLCSSISATLGQSCLCPVEDGLIISRLMEATVQTLYMLAFVFISPITLFTFMFFSWNLSWKPACLNVAMPP